MLMGCFGHKQSKLFTFDGHALHRCTHRYAVMQHNLRAIVNGVTSAACCLQVHTMCIIPWPLLPFFMKCIEDAARILALIWMYSLKMHVARHSNCIGSGNGAHLLPAILLAYNLKMRIRAIP
jgi:hypothetical protein